MVSSIENHFRINFKKKCLLSLSLTAVDLLPFRIVKYERRYIFTIFFFRTNQKIFNSRFFPSLVIFLPKSSDKDKKSPLQLSSFRFIPFVLNQMFNKKIEIFQEHMFFSLTHTNATAKKSRYWCSAAHTVAIKTYSNKSIF